MIKREYFFSGHVSKERDLEFSGIACSTSFFQDSTKVMDEVIEAISKSGGIDKEQIIVDNFKRV